MQISKVRFEHFGGIIATEDPVNLVWVDREYLTARGYHGGSVWTGEDPGYLRGPVEGEITVTTKCNLHCECCYTNAGANGHHLPYDTALDILDQFARLEVFHVAFGGGEPLLYPELLPLAVAARDRGMIPALTTNGSLVTPQWAAAAAGLFGRVNVSVAAPADIREESANCYQAVQTLRAAGITCGVNFIVHPGNGADWEATFRASAAAGADSILLLRPKPSGRGGAVYRRVALDSSTRQNFMEQIRTAHRRTGLPFHLDCALAPLLLQAGPSRRQLEFWGAQGCIAALLLVTVDIDGLVHPCSHLQATAGHYRDLPKLWHSSELFQAFRRRFTQIDGSCQECRWLDLCGGGCAVVNEFYGLPFGTGETDICG